MGELAATTLLKKLARERQPETIRVEPELIIRESTGPVPASTAAPASTRKRKS